MHRVLLCSLAILSLLFIQADYSDVTEGFGSALTGIDTLSVYSGGYDTSEVFVIDKYNNKVLSIILDDVQNTSNNADDQYNFKVYLLQGVLVYNNNNRLYLTKSYCADSVISDSLNPNNIDTTHFSSQGLFYYNIQPDYTQGFAIVIKGLAGTRTTGTKPRAYIRIDQRKR